MSLKCSIYIPIRFTTEPHPDAYYTSHKGPTMWPPYHEPLASPYTSLDHSFDRLPPQTLASLLIQNPLDLLHRAVRCASFEACMAESVCSPNYVGLRKSKADKRRKKASRDLVRGRPYGLSLDLPEELNGVHDTFHVSNLKKCLVGFQTLQGCPLDEIRGAAKIAIIQGSVNQNAGLNSRGNVKDPIEIEYRISVSDVSLVEFRGHILLRGFLYRVDGGDFMRIVVNYGLL
ncbi:hypothetical protein Tco_0084890 [Tanacetum coccineum]